MKPFNNDWDNFLKDELSKGYYLKIGQFLKNEYRTKVIYPQMSDVFSAFKITPLNEIKVVILGQDPYHQKNQAQGLCFSVNSGVKIPPSLANIFKELSADVGFKIPSSGDLTAWASQGVLLLNTVLTVEENKPNSHKNCGWQTFTDKVIEVISKNASPCVFMLWGGNAKRKECLIDGSKHLILKCAHPSPLSAYNGFFGCRHFSQANQFLNKQNKQIVWGIN